MDASRQTEEPYRLMFERNPLPMWVFDAETLRFLAVNVAATESYGYSVGEFLEMSIRDIRPAEDVPQLMETLSSADRAGFARAGLWRHRTRDGRILWAEIFSHGLVYHGRPARLVLAHDVTERRAIEEALHESEQRYRTLFDQSPLGVLHFDCELRVLACNPPLAEALGFGTPDALIGFDLSRIRDPRVLPAFHQALKGERSLYEGPYQSTHRRVHVWIAVHISPLHDGEGRVEGGIAVIEDITARKLAETKLSQQARALQQVNEELQQRTRQMEAALESRNRVYAAMNHELRTPISAIMLFNDLLLDGAIGPMSGQQTESVQHAQRAAQHLLELVEDMLDLARLDAGRMTVVPDETSVRELIEDLVHTVRPLAERQGCAVELRFAPSLRSVVTDAKRVRQIVLNLLSNALKFGAGKPVTLSCDPAPGGGVEIVVADLGMGIDPEDQERIFDAFVQVGPAGEGSGLGLSISRRLAGLLGGSLDLDSEPGRGSRFRLLLPAATPDNSETHSHPISTTRS